ncbi:MAG: nuclear transport factor 2 family protein [Rhodospirillales bacterium]|nr:nuclear transport factor 2 family protein [Rhodospirillales bacterium]
MTGAEFAALLDRMTTAAEAGDGRAFAACFAPDGVYHDYIYGDHAGRDGIADMLENYFHRDAADYRWRFFDPVVDGDLAYAWSLSAFTSTVPEFAGKRVVIDGMSRFRLRGGLIADYAESVNGGVAMAQLGVAPARMAKVMDKWSGWLKARPETKAYLERK